MTPLLNRIFVTAGILLLGTLGGFAALALNLPLPFMLGSLLTTSIAVIVFPRMLPADYKAPADFRGIFIAFIGLSIGARVTWQVLGDLVHAIPSFIALTAFVPFVLWTNYLIFRRIGGYDRATAYFCGTPGGLVEAMLMGEEAGADERLVTMQQFLRIIMVVTLVPVGMSLYYGEAVGSAGGMSFSGADAGLGHAPEVLVMVALGFALGKWGPLPAGQFVGPLLVGAFATLSGLAVVEMPGYVISTAQVVIGSMLGARFLGINGRMILRGMGLSLMSVGSMLAIACIAAFALRPMTGEPIDVLVISFAPGGVTEMALIALSLHANPAFVTMHHIYRILLTIVTMSLGYRRYIAPGGG